MDSYPEPAAAEVARLTASAAADPAAAAAFQGAPGAYSHQAVREALPDAVPLPCLTFAATIDAVRDGRAARAVLPVENSQAGRVADIHFLLPESGLHIVGEHFVRVRHCLLGRSGAARADIVRAHSHPQALGQCRHRLASWGIEARAEIDTASSAALVASTADPSMAAIASELAGELYGLDTIEAGIEDEAHNTTRFLILSTETGEGVVSADAITTLIFEVRSVPAALFKALGGFATNGVNLTKLESYMRGGQFRAAEFYVDIEGRPEDPPVARALDELAHFSKWVRILGTYRSALKR